MIDESRLMVTRGVARRDFLMVRAEVIEEALELGAEAPQRRAVSQPLAGGHASHDQESILAELTLSMK
jgi:hypothetical protein